MRCFDEHLKSVAYIKHMPVNHFLAHYSDKTSLTSRKFGLPLNLLEKYLASTAPNASCSLIDVGAYRGSFVEAVRASCQSIRNLPVHCFDAFQGNVEAVRERAFPAITVNHFAVTNQRTTNVTFSIPRNSYTNSNVSTWGGRVVSVTRAQQLADAEDQIEVPAITLEHYINTHLTARPALIKIDVQGGELDVVKSLGSYTSLIPLVYLECQLLRHRDLSFVNFMEEQGYDVIFDEFQVGLHHINDKPKFEDLCQKLDLKTTWFQDHGCIYCTLSGSGKMLIAFLNSSEAGIFTYFQTDLLCLNRSETNTASLIYYLLNN
jgi:FkbM family methyltransferase